MAPRYLDSLISTYSSSQAGDPGYQESLRFFYSLDRDLNPRFVLAQREELEPAGIENTTTQSHNIDLSPGTRTTWNNYYLYYYNFTQNKIERHNLNIYTNYASPYRDKDKTFLLTVDAGAWSGAGMVVTSDVLRGFGSEETPGKQLLQASVALDHTTGEVNASFAEARSADATKNTYSYKLKASQGTTTVRTPTNNLVATVALNPTENKGYGITISTTAANMPELPYRGRPVNELHQMRFSPSGGSFETIVSRSIALDLLRDTFGNTENGFFKVLQASVLDKSHVPAANSTLLGLMPTQTVVSLSNSESTTSTWSYELGYPKALSITTSGVYDDQGLRNGGLVPQSTPGGRYEDNQTITGTYTSEPRLIGSALSKQEQANLLAAIEYANKVVLSNSVLPKIDLSDFAAITPSTTFGLVLNPTTLIKDLLKAVPEAVGLANKQPRDFAPGDGVTLNVTAPGWSQNIQLIRISTAGDGGARLETRQPEIGFASNVGSLIIGGPGRDVITGGFGWDIADGGGGNDMVKVGNGRDVLTGGAGADELWGGFGWNTFRTEQDGSADLLVIRSDHWLVNPRLNNTAFNNTDGSKADVIEGLDSVDRLIIQGVNTTDITIKANASRPNGVAGLGIYTKGVLEAIYTGGNLTEKQLIGMVSGDNSAAAIANGVWAYGSEWKQ